ncbi:GatB/YqeY domain-containing protein [Aquipuribacter nitratireducens]|uniref:GatB/YqeY domain-containing protein n=1 Tax=Aquipuribacter nitratireducens TaxID=650104 RepID=A0ABW0GRT3_9MICO
MSFVENLRADLTAAMRAGDALRVGTLRMVLTAVREVEVSGRTQRTLSDAEAQKVVAKEAKKRRESAQVYTDAGRPELAEREQAEAELLEQYLPQQLSPAELEALVDEVIAAEGYAGLQQMGAAMKAVNARVQGRADGGAVAALVRSRLT